MASFNIRRFIKNPKKGLENAGRSVGKAASDAAPLVGLIPGVGTGYGATIGALGSVAAGNNRKTSLKKGIEGGLSGFANTKLLGGKGYKGVIPAVRRVLGGGVPGAPKTSGGINPNVPLPEGLDPTMAEALGYGTGAGTGNRGGFDWGGALGTALNWGKDHAVDIGIGGLAAWQTKHAADASKRAGQLQDKALAGAEGRWNDNAPLRSEGRRRLLNPTRPDLSSVYGDPNNPFSHPQRPPQETAVMLPGGPRMVPEMAPMDPMNPAVGPRPMQRLLARRV